MDRSGWGLGVAARVARWLGSLISELTALHRQQVGDPGGGHAMSMSTAYRRLVGDGSTRDRSIWRAVAMPSAPMRPEAMYEEPAGTSIATTAPTIINPPSTAKKIPNPRWMESTQIGRSSEALRPSKSSSLRVVRDGGEDMPYDIDTPNGHLVPWGMTDNGDVADWRRESGAPSESWTIVVNESRGPDWYAYDGPVTQFLPDVLSRCRAASASTSSPTTSRRTQ
jgi:hypothetical protein